MMRTAWPGDTEGLRREVSLVGRPTADHPDLRWQIRNDCGDWLRTLAR
jgi:hypothetical protein